MSAYTRRSFIGKTAVAIGSFAALQKVVGAGHPTDPGPANPALDGQNPDSIWPPGTDSKSLVQNFKYPFSFANKRVYEGGWSREVTIRELPVSKTLAGVNMRLTPGGCRELHWHTAGEWAIMLYGTARITAIDLDGKSFVADVKKNDLWFFPSGIPHSIQGLNPDGNPLTAVQVSGPAHGTLTLNANGGYVYTPAANYNGPDSFTYKANDGTNNSNVATVSLSVSAVNDPPAAIADAFSVNEDASLVVTAPGVLANDTDLEGNALTAVLVGGASHGSVTLNGDGSFSYAPVANYNGSDSFTYRANDGAANSNVATVAITIAPMFDPPVAVDDSYATNEDTTLVVVTPTVLANDIDVDGLPMTAILVDGALHGTVTLSANGGFTYTPVLNYNGPDYFTYIVDDGVAVSPLATSAIMVNAVNDAPVAVANSYSTSEDVALVVAGPGVLANDPDVDGNPLSAILVSGVTHGTLTLGPDGGFTYTPAANYNGPDNFTYRANDGVANSNVATVSLTINAVNDAPVAAANSYTTNEDTALTVGAPGLLANDSDVEGSPLTAIKVTSPTHGTATVNANGSFTYTPTANYNGPDSFTYRANDGSLNSATVTVTLTIIAVNDAPVATAQSRSLTEDATRAIVLAGTDADGNPLTFAIATPPAHGVLTGTAPNVTYVPAANYNGPDSFTFVANDGLVNSSPGTVSLTVTPLNDAPVGQTASYTTPRNTPKIGTLVATDVDGDSLTYSISNQGTKGTVTVNPATGAFTYTPNLNATGADNFKFKATDGLLTTAATRIDITIQP